MLSKLWIPIALVCALVLAACASNPEVRWAQMQQASNDVTDYVVQGRQPCVDHLTFPNAGPDHPLCRVSDAEWVTFKALRTSLNEALYQATMAGDAPATLQYLELAEALLRELQMMGATQ